MPRHTMHKVVSGLLLGVAFLAGVLFIGQHPARVQAQAPIPIATISPASLSANLCESQCLRETVTILLPPRSKPAITQMDVIFVLDISGSMGGVMTTVASESFDIAAELQSLVSDTRFAAGALSNDRRIAWDLTVDFTTDLDLLNRGLNGLNVTSIGDIDEATTLALHESGNLGWRPNAAKILVLFTDEPINPDDPGADMLFGTADDLELTAVLADLKATGVRVIGINSGSDSDATRDLQTVAVGTDGSYFGLTSIGDLRSTVTRAISEELGELRLTFHVEDTAQDGWFTQDPGSFDYPETGAPVEVVLEFCPGNFNLSRGVYNINLLLQESTTTYAELPIKVNYSPVCNALLIPDTPADTGNDCMTAPFWQSPGIVIRYGADGGTTSQPVRPDYPHSVYVSVKNTGFEDASGVLVTLRQADGLLSDGWTNLGQQTTDIPVGQTVWVGPFAWMPTSSTVALGATAESAEVPLRPDEPYYCDSQQAQLRQTILPLDNFSLNPSAPAGLFELTALQPDQSMSISTDGLSAGGFIGWVSSDGQSTNAQPGDGTLIMSQSDNARKLVFSNALFQRFSLMILQGREIIQGADITVQPQARSLGSSGDGTVITEYNPSFAPPNELLVILIGVLVVVVVVAILFTVLKKKQE